MGFLSDVASEGLTSACKAWLLWDREDWTSQSVSSVRCLMNAAAGGKPQNVDMPLNCPAEVCIPHAGWLEEL